VRSTAHPPTPAPRSSAQELFIECDADASDSISVQELTAGLSKRLNAGAARLVALEIMAIADEDGDEQLTREELRASIDRRLEVGEALGGLAKTHEAAFQRTFHEWLGGFFLPDATAAAKRKRIGVTVSKMKQAAGK